MKIAVINGPNMNLLGIREPDIYGTVTYEELIGLIDEHCRKAEVEVDFFQSNHEGDIVDCIQGLYGSTDGIVINPAAYTHTSIAIPDALRAVGIPAVEVHLSDISARENYRRISYIEPVCKESIAGRGVNGYLDAIDVLIEYIKENA